MYPAIMDDIAPAKHKQGDEHRAADRRARARLAEEESRPPRDGGPSTVVRSFGICRAGT
jgi:ribosomal protein S14